MKESKSEQARKRWNLNRCSVNDQIKETDDDYNFIRELEKPYLNITYRCPNPELSKLIFEYLPKIHYKKSSTGTTTWNLFQLNTLVDKIIEMTDKTYKAIKESAKDKEGIVSLNERMNNIKEMMKGEIEVKNPQRLYRLARNLKKLNDYSKLYDSFAENLYVRLENVTENSKDLIAGLCMDVLNKSLQDFIEGGSF